MKSRKSKDWVTASSDIMSCDIKTPFAGPEGMLPQMKGKLTILHEKSIVKFGQ